MKTYKELERAYLHFRSEQRRKADRGGAVLVQTAYRAMEALAYRERE